MRAWLVTSLMIVLAMTFHDPWMFMVGHDEMAAPQETSQESTHGAGHAGHGTPGHSRIAPPEPPEPEAPTSACLTIKEATPGPRGLIAPLELELVATLPLPAPIVAQESLAGIVSYGPEPDHPPDVRRAFLQVYIV